MEIPDATATIIDEAPQLFGAYILSQQQSQEFAEVLESGEAQKAADEWGFDTSAHTFKTTDLYWLWKYTKTMERTTPYLIQDMQRLLEDHNMWQTFLRLTSVTHNDNFHLMYLLWTILPLCLARSPQAIERLFQSFEYALSELNRQSTILLNDGYQEDNLTTEQTQHIIDTLYNKVTNSVKSLSEATLAAGVKNIDTTALDTLARNITLECDIQVFIARELLQLSKTTPEGFLTTSGIEMLSLDSITISCSELSTQQKQELEQLYVQNRSDVSSEELEVDIKDFRDTLDNQEAHIHLMTNSARSCVAFVCYESIEGIIYASGLTVSDVIPHSLRALASVMCMRKTLQQIHSYICLVHESNTRALNLYNNQLDVQKLGRESIPKKFADQENLVALRLSSKSNGTLK